MADDWETVAILGRKAWTVFWPSSLSSVKALQFLEVPLFLLFCPLAYPLGPQLCTMLTF